MDNILMVLGAPNDALGNLSQIAKDRLDCTFNFYQANKGFKIVCTGGFGQHFNLTEKPHHFYAQDYLMEKGIPVDAFLEAPLSANTLEDFEMTKGLIAREKPDILVVITSDFHVERVKIVCNRIIDHPQVLFLPAPSSLSPDALLPLIAHEARAIKRL